MKVSCLKLESTRAYYFKLLLRCICFLILESQLSLAFSQIDTTVRLKVNKGVNAIEQLETKMNAFENKLNTSDIADSMNMLKVERMLLEVIKADLKNTHGVVSLGYSYGLNSIFTDTSRSIGSIYNLNGEVQTSLVGVPVNVSFNYSTLKIPLGSNNYFRMSFDKERFVSKKLGELDNKLEEIGKSTGKLKEQQGKLSEMQGFLEVYLKSLEQKIKTTISDSLTTIKDNALDSANAIYVNSKIDKDTVNLEEQLNGTKANLVGDTTLSYQEYKEKYEKAKKTYGRIILLKDKITKLLMVYKELNSKAEQAKANLKPNDLVNNARNKLDKPNFISSVQKLDLGLTYPSTTGLSDQSIAVKGFGAEFQVKNYYVSISSGLTLNNTMLSTNEITNEMNYKQNVFNQFDFQQVLDNGILTVFKTGWGNPNSTHLFLGTNYLTNARFFSKGSSNKTYDPALSLEIEAVYVPTFYKDGKLELVYGKTSINSYLSDSSTDNNVFRTLFSNIKSNYYSAKYTQGISCIKSVFSLDFKNIDPMTNTTVFGMLQPGNRRWSFESKHKINSYVKLGSRLKREESLGGENRLLLHTIGGDLNGGFKSYISYFLMLNYVNYNLSNSVGQSLVNKQGDSYLVGANVTGNYKVKDFKLSTSINYNDYLIADTSQMNKYRQMGIKQIMADRVWKSSIGYDYFYKRNKGIVAGTHVFDIGGTYLTPKMQMSLNLSLAIDEKDKTSYGFKVEVNREVLKMLSLSVIAERFVKGDFYRSFYESLYNQFPYLFTINAHFKF